MIDVSWMKMEVLNVLRFSHCIINACVWNGIVTNRFFEYIIYIEETLSKLFQKFVVAKNTQLDGLPV